MANITNIIFDLRDQNTVQTSQFRNYDTLAWTLKRMSEELRRDEFNTIYLKPEKVTKLLVELSNYFDEIQVFGDAFNKDGVIITTSWDGEVAVESAKNGEKYIKSCALVTLMDEDCSINMLNFHKDNDENISLFTITEEENEE